MYPKWRPPHTHMSPYIFPQDWLVNIDFFALMVLMASFGSNLHKNWRVPIFLPLDPHFIGGQTWPFTLQYIEKKLSRTYSCDSSNCRSLQHESTLQINLYSKMHFTPRRGSKCTPNGGPTLSKTHMSPYSFPQDWLVNIDLFCFSGLNGFIWV